MGSDHVTPRLRNASAAVLAWAVAIAASCAHGTSERLPLCGSELTAARLDADVPIPLERWFELLLRGYDPELGMPSSPATTCSRQRIDDGSQRDPCGDGHATVERPTPHRLRREHLIFGETSVAGTLVWLITASYGDGDGVGPVALVKRSDHGLRVEALGVMRFGVEDVRLRLASFVAAEGDPQQLVIAEALRCATELGADCVSETQLLPRVGSAFVNVPLTSAGGRCLGLARFALGWETEVLRTTGFTRHARATAAVDIIDGALVIQEHVAVADRYLAAPDIEPVTRGETSARREIRIRDGQLVLDAESLWSELLRSAGAPPIEETSP